MAPYKGKRRITLRQRLNRFVYEEFGIEDRDLDIRFKLGNSRYRIPQFSTLWIILESIFVVTVSVGIYSWIVLMIMTSNIVGGI
jgi:hypothetical protein